MNSTLIILRTVGLFQRKMWGNLFGPLKFILLLIQLDILHDCMQALISSAGNLDLFCDTIRDWVQVTL